MYLAQWRGLRACVSVPPMAVWVRGAAAWSYPFLQRAQVLSAFLLIMFGALQRADLQHPDRPMRGVLGKLLERV